MPLASNEFTVLGVVADQGPIDAVECARHSSLGPGMTDATLRSLTNKGFVVANKVRQGFSKRPDGTYSATREGRAALAS